MENITAVFTSCGRWDLLERTLTSFINTVSSPDIKYIVIDNSTLATANDEINKILDKNKTKGQVIINETNIGQVSSIDKAYSFVKTDYIFHSEDDWFYTGSNYLEQSLDVLCSVPQIVNVNIRARFDGEKGGDAPIGPLLQTSKGTKYHLYELNYLNMWHGFSWNPGLRKTLDYNIIGRSYKKIGQEQHVGQVYKDLGYRAACLEGQYAKHIGTNSSTPLSNQ
jgi:GT2 family glycosyltransferase